jgi:mannose-1-phosphate guanylyltransferase/phosphomannomutase
VRVGGDGGVHIRVAPNDPNALIMEFFDSQGITTDKGTERKIENLFFREDFRRTGMDDVGLLDFPSRMLERYTGAFLEALSAHAVKEAGFKVVIDYAWGNASIVLPQLLGGLGVDQISLNAYFDAQRARNFRDDRERHLEQLATVVTSLEADLGLLIDADGETFTLVDDRGRIVGRNRLFALLTLLIARATPGARIAMPVTVPDAVERIAEQNGATIVRTRSDRRSLMALAEQDGKSLAFAGGSDYELIFPEFQPAFDGLYGAAKVMELLAAEHQRASELVDQLPIWHMASRAVPCPWDRKGLVMRALHDESRNGNNVQMIDGIRISENGGWVLVLPDASEAAVNVIAESTSDESAEGTAVNMANHLMHLIATG